MIVCAKHCYLYVPSCSLLFCHECGPVLCFSILIFQMCSFSVLCIAVFVRECGHESVCTALLFVVVFRCAHFFDFQVFNCDFPCVHISVLNVVHLYFQCCLTAAILVGGPQPPSHVDGVGCLGAHGIHCQ